MLKQESITDSRPAQARHMLQPTSGLQRRCFPDLQLEIGEDEADLLLQIDYWINTEGQDGAIIKSAAEMQPAFPGWAVRKIQRVVQSLSQQGYIRVTPTITRKGIFPEISLNYFRLISVNSLDTAWIMLHLSRQFVESLIVTYIRYLPSDLPSLIEKLCNPPAPDQVSDPGRGCDKFDAPGATPVTQGSDTSDAPTPLIYKDSFLRLYNQDSQEGAESDRTYDPAPDDDPPPLKNNTYHLAEALAEACQLDLDLNQEQVWPHAQELEKGGFEPEDIQDVAWWWPRHDWRGKKNGQPPHLHQIKQVIHQALSHPDVIRRRQLRAEGIDPDDANPYIAGELSDYIQR